MKKIIRKSVFETNSSSVHSLILKHSRENSIASGYIKEVKIGIVNRSVFLHDLTFQNRLDFLYYCAYSSNKEVQFINKLKEAGISVSEIYDYDQRPEPETVEILIKELNPFYTDDPDCCFGEDINLNFFINIIKNNIKFNNFLNYGFVIREDYDG